MANRRNFTRAVKIEIIKRSMVKGVPTCDEVVGALRCVCQKGLAVHHKKMDAMEVDKTRKLTAADGELLCKAHHDPITKEQKGVLKKTLAVEAAHLGAKRDKQPIPSDPHALKSRARPKHEGRTGLPPRPMFVKLGDVASGVLARITPRKDAAE
jgi:hypothetical protein